MIQTYFFGICITPEDNVALQEVRDPHSVTFALGWHQCSYKAPVNICHHHFTAIGENELWQSTCNTEMTRNR